MRVRFSLPAQIHTVMIEKPKVLVILGPTASGKSDLAVALAKKFKGEVISADSRQVYEGLAIGTGKITKKEMKGVKHHLLDVISPKKTFTVEEFQRLAEKAIENILKKKKLPIICGGTGFYIQAIVENKIFPNVPPNPKLRKSLEKKSAQELFFMLVKKDVRRASNIDFNNKVRLIRALEIAEFLGSVPELATLPRKYEFLQIGIKTDDKKLKERIQKRLVKRIKSGMLKEAIRLHKAGLSWKRMEDLGLEYRYMARLLQNKISEKQFMHELNQEIWRYAKRQKTWFKKDKTIRWFTFNQKSKIEKAVKSFLK